jgi:hypothetical protein
VANPTGVMERLAAALLLPQRGDARGRGCGMQHDAPVGAEHSQAVAAPIAPFSAAAAETDAAATAIAAAAVTVPVAGMGAGVASDVGD